MPPRAETKIALSIFIWYIVIYNKTWTIRRIVQSGRFLLWRKSGPFCTKRHADPAVVLQICIGNQLTHKKQRNEKDLFSMYGHARHLFHDFGFCPGVPPRLFMGHKKRRQPEHPHNRVEDSAGGWPYCIALGVYRRRFHQLPFFTALYAILRHPVFRQGV